MQPDSEQIHKFEEIFNSRFRAVKNFAGMLLKSEDEAEDIAQEVFIKLWAKTDVWINNPDIDNYIYVMARNAVLNLIKHKKIEKTYQTASAQESLINELFIDKNALDDMCCEEVSLLIELAINRLPEQRKKIFEMSRGQEMSHQKIASILNISVRTVDHQIYLALQELKKLLVLVIFLQIV